jgi:hypothetical protein
MKYWSDGERLEREFAVMASAALALAASHGAAQANTSVIA